LQFPHGRSHEAALRQIRVAVAGALKWLSDEKREAPEPLGSKKFRGHLTLRVPPEVHRELAIKAAEENVSIKQLILSKIIERRSVVEKIVLFLQKLNPRPLLLGREGGKNQAPLFAREGLG